MEMGVGRDELIARSGYPVDQVVLERAGEAWLSFPKAVSRGVPKGVRKFLGRRPGRELVENKYSATHVQFALLMALTGESVALRHLFRGDLLLADAVKPYTHVSLERRVVVNQWCAQRVGLTGWAEVFDVPPNSEPSREARIPRTGFYLRHAESLMERDWPRWWGTPEELGGLYWQSASSFVANLRQVLDGLGGLLVARGIPWMNDLELSDQFLAEEIDWCARMVRAR